MEAAWQSASVRPPEKRHNRAFRLTRAAWRLASRDPALAPLALLLAGSVAFATVLLLVATSHLSHGIHALSLFALLLIGFGFGVIFLTAFFGAAIAHAASAGFDGVSMTVREAIAEARESLGQLLAWSAIGTGILAAAELIVGTGRAGAVAGSLGLGLWGFFVAFVVPIVALDGATAGEAIRESAALARRRWGEELVGSFAIAFLWALAAFVCLMVYVPGLHAFRAHHGGGSAVAMALGGLAGLMTFLYAVATAHTFAVALLRFDNGESTFEQLESPPPPIYTRSAAPRIAGLALCTAALAGLVALAASAGIAERREQYYTALPSASAAGLEAGAPVVYEERTVGQVLATWDEGVSTRVSFELEESVVAEARSEPIGVDVCDSRPCLRIGLAPPLAPTNRAPPPAPSSPLARQGSADRPPTGRWQATGTVLSAVNLANEPAGSTLERSWAFGTTCKLSSCRTLFVRETLYGRSVTELMPHHGYYTAAFPPVAVPCAGPEGLSRGRPGRLYDSYRLQWSADRQTIVAIEHQTGLGRCGPTSSQTTRWTAEPSNPSPAFGA